MVHADTQAYTFLCAMAGGAAAALLYDIFRIFRKTVKTGAVATCLQDLIYWLMVSVIISVTIYYSNDGELRAYLFIGAATGALLYAVLLSRAVMTSSLIVIKAAIKLVRTAVFVISYPARALLRLLLVPARRLARVLAAAARKARSRSRIGISKLSFMVRYIKHAVRKI